MRIVKAAVERVGSEVREILFVELAQGANERIWFGHRLRRVSVGLVLEFPAEQIEQRREPKSDGAAEQGKKEQRGNDAAWFESERTVEPGLIGELCDDKEGY